MLFKKSVEMVDEHRALPGRSRPAYQISGIHAVNGNPIEPPFPDGMEEAVLAMGCFWGAERLFWQLPGVFSTAVGYSGGFTPHPTYEETCTGLTGHTEVVRVVFDPQVITYGQILQVFFDEHDPTQGMRQGNDVGTQYRSAIYWRSPAHEATARSAAAAYDAATTAAGVGSVTTELAPAGPFYAAEEYHQQYLHKNPNGYCGLRGTGVTCAVADPVGG